MAHASAVQLPGALGPRPARASVALRFRWVGSRAGPLEHGIIGHPRKEPKWGKATEQKMNETYFNREMGKALREKKH